MPLNLLIFGDVTKEIIDFATTILDSTLNQTQRDAASDKLLEVLKSFAIYNSMVGTTMLVLSYFSTVIFNYTAVKQVRTVCRTRTMCCEIEGFTDISNTAFVLKKCSKPRYRMV